MKKYNFTGAKTIMNAISYCSEDISHIEGYEEAKAEGDEVADAVIGVMFKSKKQGYDVINTFNAIFYTVGLDFRRGMLYGCPDYPYRPYAYDYPYSSYA